MRLIDAEAFETDVRKRYCKDCNKGSIFCTVCETENMLSEIEEAPTIEARPVVHAHWEKFGISKEGIDYICSECAFTISADEYPKNAHYCPYCGVQMDELVSNTDELNSSVKIPVISTEDVPKLMEEKE